MRYIALLRAVNVGGRTVKMDRLRALFEEMKLRNVETFIASGNVIFESTASEAALESRIEKHLMKSLGFAVPALVRSAPDFAAVAARVPFTSHPPLERVGALYVGFLKSQPHDGLRGEREGARRRRATSSRSMAASCTGAPRTGGRCSRFRSRSSSVRSAARRPSATSRRCRRSPSGISVSRPLGASGTNRLDGRSAGFVHDKLELGGVATLAARRFGVNVGRGVDTARAARSTAHGR